MIYDPLTRQSVRIVGRYHTQHEAFCLGECVPGEYYFVRVRYEGAGDIPRGAEHDIERRDLVADHGAVEVNLAAAETPFLD